MTTPRDVLRAQIKAVSAVHFPVGPDGMDCACGFVGQVPTAFGVRTLSEHLMAIGGELAIEYAEEQRIHDL